MPHPLMPLVHRSKMHMVIHVKAPKRSKSKAITVRVPESDYCVLREYAKGHDVSLNAIVSDAVGEYAATLKRLSVIDDIADFQRRLGKRTPPTNVEDIHAIRRSRVERLASDKREEGSHK